uniref:ATP synthase subunit a n=1 Tax=Atypus karschi TaxID=2337319 RepID=A0A8A5Y6R6_9ARAC|nr:ATP synthase F0 subunit 6 [Atypus karschi]QTH31098.1 ATP synthase F0 subunit 6 [Atypus karschi]
MSLFSMFDPSGTLELKLNWLSIFLILFFPLLYNFSSSKLLIVFLGIVSGMKKFFKEMMGGSSFGVIYLGLSMFLLLVYLNLLGLVPFVFSSTSHVVVTLSMGLVFWMSFFVMGFLKNFLSSVSHLVPEGCPLMLAPFLVMIESISHLIRPITLSIRLAANMMAGHLIIGLISEMSMTSSGMSLLSIFFQIFMMMLEMGVCIIQAMVFSILLMLYMVEYY